MCSSDLEKPGVCVLPDIVSVSDEHVDILGPNAEQSLVPNSSAGHMRRFSVGLLGYDDLCSGLDWL